MFFPEPICRVGYDKLPRPCSIGTHAAAPDRDTAAACGVPLP